MALPAFSRIYTDFFPMQKLQDQVALALNRLLGQPDVPKLMLVAVDLTTTPQDIPHGLGYPVANYLVCRRSAAASVYDSQASNPMPEQTLRLSASAPVRVNLLVF